MKNQPKRKLKHAMSIQRNKDMKMVKLTIDSKEVEVPAGTTILDAAKSVQIKIPTLCHHPDLPPTAACGICIVKAGGRMVRSCCTPVAEGSLEE